MGKNALGHYMTGRVERVLSRYDPEHDAGPDAPIHWSVETVANALYQLGQTVEVLEVRVNELEMKNIELRKEVIKLGKVQNEQG